MSAFGITMNISDLSIARARKETSGTRRTATPVNAIGEQVDISDTAFCMAAAESLMQSMPEVDMALVQEMKAAIAGGELKIDYHSLAQKMLSIEGALGNAQELSSDTD